MVRNPVHWNLMLFGTYTGMRRGEIALLRWERMDLEAGLFLVEETKTGSLLERPITRQPGTILPCAAAGQQRRYAGGHAGLGVPRRGQASRAMSKHSSSTTSGSARSAVPSSGGLHNAFIAEAERGLMLPRSLAKQMATHTRPSDMAEGDTADWPVGQFREPGQIVAGRIDAPMGGETLCQWPAYLAELGLVPKHDLDTLPHKVPWLSQ